MNLNDFWIFSRSGRDFSGAFSTARAAKRVVWVLIRWGLLFRDQIPVDRHVCPQQPHYRQTCLSRVKIDLMVKSKDTGPRARILEVAERLFYTEGVRATGTEKIMSVSEVAKATF